MSQLQSIVSCRQSSQNPQSRRDWKRIYRIAIMLMVGSAGLMYQPVSQAGELMMWKDQLKQSDNNTACHFSLYSDDLEQISILNILQCIYDYDHT